MRAKIRADVVVVGAGHNGLVAALLLARRGLDVLVLESQNVIGGAARPERPFAKAPDLTSSTEWCAALSLTRVMKSARTLCW